MPSQQIDSYLMTIRLDREDKLEYSNNEHIYESHTNGMCLDILPLEMGSEAGNYTGYVKLVIKPHKF